jgi:hypothetical protein
MTRTCRNGWRDFGSETATLQSWKVRRRNSRGCLEVKKLEHALMIVGGETVKCDF